MGELFSCELCEFKCNSERTLFSHMSNRNIASKSAQEQERFSCELCEFKCNSERTLFSHMSTNHDTTKDVKQADNSKLENVFHTKRKIVKYTHDGEWVDYCPSPITKPSN